jgi:hypothetical protein
VKERVKKNHATALITLVASKLPWSQMKHLFLLGPKAKLEA